MRRRVESLGRRVRRRRRPRAAALAASPDRRRRGRRACARARAPTCTRREDPVHRRPIPWDATPRLRSSCGTRIRTNGIDIDDTRVQPAGGTRRPAPHLVASFRARPGQAAFFTSCTAAPTRGLEERLDGIGRRPDPRPRPVRHAPEGRRGRHRPGCRDGLDRAFVDLSYEDPGRHDGEGELLKFGGRTQPREASRRASDPEAADQVQVTLVILGGRASHPERAGDQRIGPSRPRGHRSVPSGRRRPASRRRLNEIRSSPYANGGVSFADDVMLPGGPGSFEFDYADQAKRATSARLLPYTNGLTHGPIGRRPTGRTCRSGRPVTRGGRDQCCSSAPGCGPSRGSPSSPTMPTRSVLVLAGPGVAGERGPDKRRHSPSSSTSRPRRRRAPRAEASSCSR